MNNNLKIIIGATLGGAVGWFIGSVIVDYRIYQEMKNGFPILDDTEDNDDIPGEEVVTLNSTKKIREKNQPKNYGEYFEKAGKPDLAALARKYNGESDTFNHDKNTEPIAQVESVTMYDDELSVALNIPASNNGITVIPQLEFVNSDNGYDQVTWDYYSDDVLVNEHDKPIADPEKYIGADALISFGSLSEDEDVVYVRNDARKTEYEVVRLHKNYGIEEEPKKPARRPTRKEILDARRAAKTQKVEVDEHDNEEEED